MTRAARSRAAWAAAAALALTITACSSPVDGLAESLRAVGGDSATDGSDAAALEKMQDILDDVGLGDALGDHDGGVGGSGDDGNDGEPSEGRREAPPPIVWWLDAEPASDPAGWQRVAAVCDDPEATAAAFASFAVPGDWEYAGMGSAGSSPLGMHFDYAYLSPEAGRVQVAVDSDDVDLENPAAITESFDRDMEVTGSDGTKQYHIAFERVGTVAVGQGDAELFKAEANQAPVANSDAAYKARMRHVDMPQAMWDGTWLVTEQTVVVTVSFNPGKGELPLQTVESIVGSLTFPACSVSRVIVETEMTSNSDLDGDGHISTMEDYQKALGIG